MEDIVCRDSCCDGKGSTLTSIIKRSDEPSSIPEEDGDAPSDAGQLKAVLTCLEDSKAEEIVPIDIKEKSALADFMVVASGRSQRHVMAVADHLLRRLKEIGCSNIQVEGLSGGDWVLIDIGDIIIHLFRPEVRAFYNLEKIWLEPEPSENASKNRKR